MADRPGASRRFWSALLCVSLVASMAGILPAAAAPTTAVRVAEKAAPAVTSASLKVTGERLSSGLAAVYEAAKTPAARAEKRDVAVLVTKGAKAPKGLLTPVRIALHAEKEYDLYAGKAAVGSLVKIASAKGVARVYDNGKTDPPIIPDKPKPTEAQRAKQMAAAKARVKAAQKLPARKLFAQRFDADGVLKQAPASGAAKDAAASGTVPGRDGGAATGWFDVTAAGHNAQSAWADGYMGDGVKIAVADDSVDFAHPDLQGTQALVNDAASPYYGWPEVLDPYSILLYAYDRYYSTTYVADGQSWWSDTSAVITTASPTFDTVSYTLPETSKSGVYHIGYLWEENIAGYMTGWAQYPAVLVVDENVAGVYDTVYVDVDYTYDFTLQKPCTMASPISYVDLWGPDAASPPDGMADLSGGMIYWIADGANQPPGFDFMIGPDPGLAPPASGELVCFTGALNWDENHGTLCASNVVGQGVTDGHSDYYQDDGVYPPFKTPVGGGAGIVQGAARNGKVVAFSDIYWNHFTSTLVAYDYAAFGGDYTPDSGDEVQIVSNSYGESDEDADEWDYRSRYITRLNTAFNPRVSFLFSTGNGAPGYGTNAPPTPATGIGIGASTQMGACGGWDSIYDADQVNIGDVIPWSNRGPSAAGHTGPAVVADGAYSSGAMALNQGWWDGWSSWIVWGGTSRSCPVAAGNLALVAQAFKDKTGQFPTYDEARGLLMSGARDLGYDTAVQGAGMVDSGRSVDAIVGDGGVVVAPSAWYPGDYRGTEYESYVDIMKAGDSATDQFMVTNNALAPLDVTVTDSTHELSQVVTMSVTMDGTKEAAYTFNRPDYLTDITALVNAAAPDLMVIKATESFADFAPTGAFNTTASTHNKIRLLAYNWKDQNVDGNLWTDDNASGYVDPLEIDEGEYMRFTYANNQANSHEIRVQNPSGRAIDGIFLGLQHNTDATADPATVVELRIEMWNKVDDPWITTPGAFTVAAGGSSAFDATYAVPLGTSPGFYESELVVAYAGTQTVIPVHVSVEGGGANFSFGADDIASPPAATSLMSNSEIMGYQDWGWRAESGDWRFYMTDIPDAAPLPVGATWLVRTLWPQVGAPGSMQADNDTLLYGSTPDSFSSIAPSVFGPGALYRSGASSNNNVGAGIWLWQTNTGTTEEWVSAPLTRGLNEIMVHNVVWPGTVHSLPLSGEAGVVGVDPTSYALLDAADSGSEPLGFTTSMDLNGLAAEAYGLTRTFESNETVVQGTLPRSEPYGPEDWYKAITLTNAAYLEAEIAAAGGSDLDMYIYRSDGVGGWIQVGASETSSGNEYIRIDRPVDGDYLVVVFGYSVSGTETFSVRIASPMGTDLAVTGVPAGAVTAGADVPLSLDWTKPRPALADREGTFEGVVYLGPVEAPSAITIPVTLRYPFEVEWSSPASGTVLSTLPAQLNVRFSKMVDEATINADSIYLTDGTSRIPVTLGYDAASATESLVLGTPLVPSTDYQIVVDGLASTDGDLLSTTIPFSVGAVPTIDISGVSGGGLYNHPVTPLVLIQNADESTITLDGVAWTPAEVATEGEHTLVASAKNGLAEVIRTVVFTIDLTPPAIEVTGVTDGTRYDHAVTPVVNVTGSSASTITLNGDVWTPAEIEEPGAYELVVTAEDAAGNSASKTVSFVVAMVSRSMGSNRYGTAVEISQNSFVSADAVVIATGAGFADALSASGLAGVTDSPLLLTQQASLPASVTAEITRLGAKTAYIVGGTQAVSGGVQGEIDAIPGVSVVRIAGTNRFDTAAKVAAKVKELAGSGFSGAAFLARGDDFADALAVSPFAFSKGMPVLLTQTGSLPDVTKGAIADLGITDVWVAGGDKVVSTPVFNAVDALTGVTAHRMAGLNRYETAVAVAETASTQGWGSWAYVGVATGVNFPDALGGGVATGKHGGMLLMTAPASLSPATMTAIQTHATAIYDVEVFGGPSAVSSGVADAIAALIK